MGVSVTTANTTMSIRMPVISARLNETIDWGLNLLNIPDIWKSTKGKDITVCILDSGIENNHDDLKNAIVDPVKDIQNFTSSGPDDRLGHGTFCAGIIGARSNGTGIIGVAPEVSILSGKVTEDNNRIPANNLVKGIEWAIKRKVDIISMSFGALAGTARTRQAIKDAHNNGIVLVAASGDAGSLIRIDFPAAYDECIAVGSTGLDGRRSLFSNGGRELDIMAPGEVINSTFLGNSHGSASGTSFSAAFVTGVCALILSKHRAIHGFTPIESKRNLLEHLTRNARALGSTTPDNLTGWGLIDPKKAFDNA